MKAVSVVSLFLTVVVFSASAVCQARVDAGTRGAAPSGGAEPPVYDVGAGQEPRLTPREWIALERNEIQRQRRIDKLYRIMAVEGAEFSQEKYDGYRSRMAGGITMIALGGLSLFSSLVVGTSLLFHSWDSDDDCDEGYCDDDSDEIEAKTWALRGLFFGGWASIGIGIPLLISGIRGRNRQNYLKQKDRILGPIQGVRVGLSFDPSTSSGALSLGFTF